MATHPRIIIDIFWESHLQTEDFALGLEWARYTDLASPSIKFLSLSNPFGVIRDDLRPEDIVDSNPELSELIPENTLRLAVLNLSDVNVEAVPVE